MTSNLFLFAAFFAYSLIFSAVSAQNPTDEVPAQVVKDHAQQVNLKSDASSCDIACATIAETIPENVYYMNDGKFQMWDAKQHELTPACRVEPSSTEDVVFILQTLVKENCKFAVKSGGHSRTAGASNSDGGVTIELGARMRSVETAKDKKTVKVGGGAQWFDVYSALEKEDLMVVGGRVADVGVGGLTLGGGISWFSGRYGWAADTVTEYELVLPNSTVIDVTYTSHPYLYFALRGGSNNFGIVTHFTFETFSQGPMYGGSNTYSAYYNASILGAYHKVVTEGIPKDPDAMMITTFGYYQAYDIWISACQFAHAKPEMDPPIFADFKKIEEMTGTVRVDRMANLTAELASYTPPNGRNLYSTLTYKVSAELNTRIFDLFIEAATPLKTIPGVMPALVIQPIPLETIKHMKKNGGNPLGMDEKDGALTLMSIAFRWAEAKDDEKVTKAAQGFFKMCIDAAKEMGLYHPYLYQNYASADQDVFASYGEANHKRLVEISRAVDPKGVFAKGGLCDGYFNVAEKPKEKGWFGKIKDEL